MLFRIAMVTLFVGCSSSGTEPAEPGSVAVRSSNVDDTKMTRTAPKGTAPAVESLPSAETGGQTEVGLLTTMEGSEVGGLGQFGSAASSVPAANKANAKKLYAQRCVACHGKTGKGDGPAASSLNPKPRDYSSKKWQASVTDAHIAKVISKGGVSVGKSAMMPANPDIKGKDLDAMVALIRSFAK